ncbi:MAG: hypothetical protein RL702_3056 [Pseudomonadota bacterium]|jgi:5-methylcytosine-specific restriction enzyme subunit McrC
MTHLTCHEWGRSAVGEGGFSRGQADALLAAARAHPCGGYEGTDILVDHHHHLAARQVVGVLSAPGASLEILPKVDPDTAAEPDQSVRSRLVHMLDVALGLDLSVGTTAALARQDETLLDVLVRLFADQLLAEVRRGLPRRYQQREDDLPALRGRLDATRQFTVNAVRADRLSCRFDELDPDTPLMRIMKSCVIALGRHARAFETKRRLGELRHVLADITDLPPARLPWGDVRIDRTNRRWRSLFALARLLLRREWQATHHTPNGAEGPTLLFPMNDLFESYVAEQLRRGLAGEGVEVAVQGGLRHCLGEWREGADCTGSVFLTRPDILLRRGGRVVAVIDTKWKKLSADPLDPRHGVSQTDVYQLMAYARIYECPRLMLLYPEVPGKPGGLRRHFGLAGGQERLTIATLDLAAGETAKRLGALVRGALLEPAAASSPLAGIAA